MTANEHAPSADPRLATLDDDGWTLDDAEERIASGTGLYWLPDRWVRDHLNEHVPDGGYVKLLFRIADPTRPERPAVERMWVTLDHREGDFYHGHLSNEPQTVGTAKEGMAVWFRAEHVIDYSGPDGAEVASERADVVRCGSHGVSRVCHVCEHLVPDADPRGFNWADAETVRPDAWCDECHAEVLRAGSWEAQGVKEPRIRIVCGGCYDELRTHHRRF